MSNPPSQIETLQKAYLAPTDEAGKQAKRAETGSDTTIQLSQIQAEIRRNSAGGSEINFSLWRADEEETFKQIQTVLPATPERAALLAGLRLKIDSVKNKTELSGEQKTLADLAEAKLLVIKNQLLERATLLREVDTRQREIVKNSTAASSGKAIERLGEKIKNLEGAELLVTAGIGLFAITSLYNMFKGDGNDSVLKAAARWGAVLFAADFATSGLRQDGKGLWAMTKDLLGVAAEKTGVKDEIPAAEDVAKSGLDSRFAREMLMASNVSVETVYKAWHAARTGGMQKISYRDLGLPGKYKAFSEEQLYDLVTQLFDSYPKKFTDSQSKIKHLGLSSDDIKSINNNEGYKLIEKWYIKNPSLKEHLTFGDLLLDYINDDPPPGSRVEVQSSAQTNPKPSNLALSGHRGGNVSSGV